MKMKSLFTSAGINFGTLEHNPLIHNITLDSRQVVKDSLFIAIKGNELDGHNYIESAIEKGASVIVYHRDIEIINHNIPFIKVENIHEASALLSNAFYDFPSSKLFLIGITGTNGKTTTATLVYELLTHLGQKVGLISTIENKIDAKVIRASLTTPDVISLNKLLSEMVDDGCTHAVMEVSSHAVVQKRIFGLEFNIGVFTNITRDHLDYHVTFQNYLQAKQSFFSSLGAHTFILINADDKNSSIMVQNSKAQIKTYSLKNLADFKAKIIENTLHGLLLDINKQEVYLQLCGEFNAYNCLCAFGIASICGFDSNEILVGLSNLKGVKGRFQKVMDVNNDIIYIIDYAHTPDALEKIQQSIKKIKFSNAKLITVIGCGGDRDKGKRPEMAKIASQYSDLAIFTNDNPRSEDPEQIINDMFDGLTESEKKDVIVVLDRKQAINTASKIASKKDVILVAGKGHENYQEIAGKKYDFDDSQVIKDIIGV